MRVFRMIACLALAISLSLSAIAQSNKPREAVKTAEQKKAKQELEKKALALVEEIIKELSSLRLAENRVLVQANLGDMLWKHDEKRARIFFKQSLDQLAEISVSTKQELDPLKMYQANLSNQMRDQLRQEVLQLIARRDARMARDFLRNTRQNPRGPGSPPTGYDPSAAQELNLAVQIVATDPKEAFEIAEEHLEKGFQQELIQLLSQLRTKDSQLGDRLVDAIMKKLRSVNLSEDYAAASFAFVLLRSMLHPGEDEDEVSSTPKAATATNLDERIIQELMSMVVNAALSRTDKDSKKKNEYEDERPDEYLLMELESMIKDVEKYAPARVAALKARIAEISGDDPEEKKAAQFESAMEKGSTEAMMEAAAKAPDEMRDNLYQQAAMKAFEEGNTDKAKQIINEHFSDPDRRDQMIAYLLKQEIWRAASEGKLERTRQLLADIALEHRIAVLIQLAEVIAEKGDKKTAAQVLNEAREMMGGQATNFLELMMLLEIARVYGPIEAAKGFEIIDSLVEHLNALLGAAAVLDGFEFTRYFKDGELMSYSPSMTSLMVFMCAKNNGLLARGDFERAKAMADRFQRSDARLMARLAIAQAALSDMPEKEATPFFLRNFYRGAMH